MKYLFINSVYGIGSTGKIIAQQCHKLQEEGNQCLVAYGRKIIPDSSVPSIRIGKPIDYKLHGFFTRCFDFHGFCSKHATIEFLKKVEIYAPDVVWLHNLHGYYINIELLFTWLKKHPEIQVYWTLHDCWTFTGHCSHFTMARCDHWKSGCKNCPQLREYPATYGTDHSKRNYMRKYAAFTGVKNMQLITPSMWLANLTRESFLAEYPVEIVNNTVDKNIFKPTMSDFRQRLNLENKFIVLGVSAKWEQTKGLPDMLKLRERLPSEYVIVLVGATKSQIKSFPDGVIGITRTDNQTELAGIYTVADVFVNPTHQDNYPTVNLEARACGTPVITYNVGGSPESAGWEYIVEEGNIEDLVEQIKKLVKRSPLRAGT